MNTKSLADFLIIVGFLPAVIAVDLLTVPVLNLVLDRVSGMKRRLRS